jgi:hypothetical protein
MPPQPALGGFALAASSGIPTQASASALGGFALAECFE